IGRKYEWCNVFGLILVQEHKCTHHATSSLRWSIHRPKCGWYLRVRSPSFPQSTFIPLIPPAPKPAPASVTMGTIPTISAPEDLDGTLAFSVRTSRHTGERVTTRGTAHQSKLHAITLPNPTTVTHFIFYPSLLLPTSTTLSPALFPFFFHALACIIPSLPIRSTASFTLMPSSPQVGNMAVPLLTFRHHTPTVSVLTTGLLDINKGIERQRQLGVAPGFWVAVVLAYLEFLTERDSYLAATNG
ncbi:hypothetical protein JB92DRAFT_2843610, partial [Gautieria morchelliformis]